MFIVVSNYNLFTPNNPYCDHMNMYHFTYSFLSESLYSYFNEKNIERDEKRQRNSITKTGGRMGKQNIKGKKKTLHQKNQ